MRKLLLLILLFPVCAIAQVNNATNTTFTNGLASSKFFNQPHGTTEPLTGVLPGSLFYNTTTSKQRIYNGSMWVDLAPDLSGYVPTSRTINGYPLSSNITLGLSDLTQTSSFRTVTDAQISSWDGKATLTSFSGTAPIVYNNTTGVFSLSGTIPNTETFTAAVADAVRVDRVAGNAAGFGIYNSGIVKSRWLVGTDGITYLQQYDAAGSALGHAFDVSATTGRISFPLKPTMTQATTATASFNTPIASGTPTSPVEGDWWLTTTGLNIRYNTSSWLMANTSQSQTFTNKLHSTGSTWQGNTVATAYGGTGLTGYAIGDLLYASNPTTLATLTATATGNVLKSGTFPSWGKVLLTTEVTGILPTANGGTGLTNLGTANQSLRVNAGATALEYYTPSTSSGTVTSITPGYGFTSNTPITTSGTMTIDTTTAIVSKTFAGRYALKNQTNTFTDVYTSRIFSTGATSASEMLFPVNTDPALTDPSMQLYASPSSTGYAGYGLRVKNSSAGGSFSNFKSDLIFPITGDRQYTFPDKSGTVALTSDFTQIVEITGTTQQAAVNTIYIPHNAVLTTITLPITSTIGSLVQVIGEGTGTGNWVIAQNASQRIVGVGISTTTGTGGSITSTDPNCTISLRLTAANKWTITSSQGTLTPL